MCRETDQWSRGTTSHGERRGTTNGAGGLTIMGFIAYDGGLRDGAIKYMISIGY
jgi:hypothetical protein